MLLPVEAGHPEMVILSFSKEQMLPFYIARTTVQFPCKLHVTLSNQNGNGNCMVIWLFFFFLQHQKFETHLSFCVLVKNFKHLPIEERGLKEPKKK